MVARHALALAQRTFGPENFNTSGADLGRILLDRGDPVEAERWLRHALLVMRSSFPSGHPDEGDLLNRLAYVVAARGADDADAVYREAVAFDDARGEGPVSPMVCTFSPLCVTGRETSRAPKRTTAALGLYRRQLANGHPYRAAAATGLGAVLLDAGHPAEAASYLQEGLAQWQLRRPAEPERVEEARALLERAIGRSSEPPGS